MLFKTPPPLHPQRRLGRSGGKEGHHMPRALCARPCCWSIAACASLFDFGRQELDSDAQRGFRIKPHLLSLQPVTPLVLTKVGGAEEKDGASPGRWGGEQADNVGEGRGRSCCPSHPRFFSLSSSHRSTICSQTWRVCICFPFSNSLCKKQLMK